jgi:SNF2 family DNA or RNA helicase
MRLYGLKVQKLTLNSNAKKKKYRESGHQTKGATAVDAEHLLLQKQLYMEAGRAKLPSSRNLLTQFLRDQPSDKILVFAHHEEILNALESHVASLRAPFIRIDGKTAQLSRQPLCDRFQKDPACRVALLSLTAAGVGLTLHAATLVVFAELYWNPGQLLQAEDRAHRVGQERPVEVRYLLCRDSLDDVQWQMIAEKLKVVGGSVDGQSQALDCVGGARKGTGARAADVNDDVPADPATQRRIDEYFLKLAAPAPEPMPKRPAPPPTESCPLCGSPVAAAGLPSHMQEVRTR